MTIRNEIPGLCAIFLIAGVSPVFCDVPATTIDGLMDAALETDSAAGIQVTVIQGGETVYSGAAGKADLEQNIPMGPDSKLRIGSVSKIFTYALVLSLIDEGLIDPDADVRDYYPGFPDHGSPITARQLASHTSGIRHYDFSNPAEANSQVYYEKLSDALSVFSGDALLAPPGQAFHYSSYGVNLLGVVAESAAGMGFAQAMHMRVLTPLGLDDSTIDHPLMLIPGRGRFYTRWDGQLVNTLWRDSSDFYPSGGMLASADDLAKLTQAMFAGDFLSADAGESLRTEATLDDGSGVGYTFGWQVADDGNVFHHGGQTNGGYAFVYRDDASDLVIAGVANYNIFPRTEEPAFFILVRETLPALFGGGAVQ